MVNFQIDTEGESSTDSSSGGSSSTITSASSSSEEECKPTPAKKAKKVVKKKARKPHKALAKKAAKRGDRKSDKSMQQQAEKAVVIDSEKLGDEMESELTRFGTVVEEWQRKGVEEENIQRFAARTLIQLQKLDVFCAVDTAIFKKEIGHVRLLELECGPVNSDSGLDRSKLKERANELLSIVANTENLDQTREGTAWTSKEAMSTSKYAGKFVKFKSKFLDIL